MPALNEKIFREYDIRGVADRDLTPEVVQKLSHAVGTFYRKHNVKRVTLGHDCRVSSPRITEAMTAGLLASGIDVVDIGLVPTPLLYFSVFDGNMDGGIMITGSHNPPDQNGLKICCGKSTIHGEEIQQIKQLLLSGDFPQGEGKRTEQEFNTRYLDHVVGNIKHPLGLKVVVDSGNGMGGMIAPELYRRLGCEVTDLYSTPDGTFPNHHPDPTVPDNLKELIQKVKEKDAIVGIGFDGDADRIGAVDRRGRILYGDELLILYSRAILKQHPKAKIISEVKASSRLYQDIERHGGIPIMWKTGHSLIKSKMKEEGALIAGEMSGHMFFNDRYFGYDDAIYAGARLLEILAETKKTPAQLLADLPGSFSTPEIRVDCPDERKFQVVDKAREALSRRGLKVIAIDGARVEFEDGWGLARASNTQPVLVFRFEATSQQRLQEIRSLVEDVVSHVIRKG